MRSTSRLNAFKDRQYAASSSIDNELLSVFDLVEAMPYWKLDPVVLFGMRIHRSEPLNELSKPRDMTCGVTPP